MKRSNAVPTSIPNTQLRQSIEEFLNAKYEAGPVQSSCSRCGSIMASVDTTFFLLDSEQALNIPVPLCLTCEPKARTTLVQ